VELLTWHAIGEDRDDVINKQLKTQCILSRATRTLRFNKCDTYFKLRSAGLSRSFQTLCPACYSRCLATETCRDLIYYIRIVYLKKFPWSSSIEIVLRLFPPNQEYFDLQFL
jgi:hypothetical protein